MHELAYPLYALCVDFMLQLAAMLGVTYRDANTVVLLVVFPAVTASLMLAVVVNWRRLRRSRSTSDA
ncbi:MAG: hypothetical protein ACAI38_04495 [Myxococcota bacterium]